VSETATRLWHTGTSGGGGGGGMHLATTTTITAVAGCAKSDVEKSEQNS